jgi:hypothetical protein
VHGMMTGSQWGDRALGDFRERFYYVRVSLLK